MSGLSRFGTSGRAYRVPEVPGEPAFHCRLASVGSVYQVLVRNTLRRFRRPLLFTAAAVLAIPLLVWVTLPWPGKLASTNPTATSFMRYREREAREAGTTLTIHQEWVPLVRIPRDLVRAVIVSEDDRFREHHGIDWKALATGLHWTGGDTFSWTSPRDWVALARALGYYWAHRHTIKGRSTITQQLAKNLYFTPRRSLLRKVEEFVVTRRLEHDLSKDRILELYLNTVELGPGIFGVGAAAHAYFGEDVGDLNAYQAASLAATLPQPLTSNPAHRPGRMAWRRDLILQRLAGRDVVIPDEPPPVLVTLPPLDSLPRPDTVDTAVTGDSTSLASPVDTTGARVRVDTTRDTIPDESMSVRVLGVYPPPRPPSRRPSTRLRPPSVVRTAAGSPAGAPVRAAARSL